jgi:23S rRNA (cytidine1920-2'-O)/16S rRNA (cytidine1409-2'-O)-methyltransferase
VGGSVRHKPGSIVPDGAELTVAEARVGWASRGAFKLNAALDSFEIRISGRSALDVGASAGGFTDALLRRGAAQVIALDVGTSQLEPRLRDDPRVISLEGMDVRDYRPDGCSPLVTVDLSFISLRLVAPDLARLTCTGGDLISLVKPQFEVGKGGLGKRGVVRDAERRARSVRAVAERFQEVGLGTMGLIRSPLGGGDRNVEYLMWSVRGGASTALEVPD